MPEMTSTPSSPERGWQGIPLLATKLHAPPPRTDLVARPRLLGMLDEGLSHRLILVAAPAGFGKTTVLSQWIATRGVRCAWLSLDATDNDAIRFCTYVIAALQRIVPGAGQAAQEWLYARQSPPLESILTLLINDLYTLPADVVLVLDDYHAIDAVAVHQAVAYLLDQCPPPLHVAVATRADPPLPLARWRARGQMAEVRADDLRFTPDETVLFCGKMADTTLSVADIQVLETRTEGWAVGLQMAALSMHGREDAGSFIRSFSGSHRYVLDYLVEEVLDRQPEEVQAFLLRTSILERLCGPLCDAVTGQDGSQAMLERLEKGNLFLIPLDDERRWYRYHHLFADLLRVRLDQVSPGLAPHLHTRAAAWLEQTGIMVEAVNHALAAGAHDRAARLVEQNTARLLAKGELNAMMGWIGALPAELRLARPWLCIHQAYALRLAGRSGEVGPLLAQAEAAFEVASAQSTGPQVDRADETDAPSVDMAEAQALKGAVAAVRAFTVVVRGQDAEAISLAERARELLPTDDLWSRTAAVWALGFALHSQGHLPEARSAFEEMVQLGRAMGNIWTLVSGLTDLARVSRDEGEIRQARALLEQALAEASREGARDLGFVARTEEHLAAVLYELNELDAAQRLLSDALAHTRLWPNPNYLTMAYVCQARILLAQGDLEGARIAIGEADQIRRSGQLTRWLRCVVEAELVRVWLGFQAAGAGLVSSDPLAEQCSALVISWRSELATSVESGSAPMDECTESVALTLARVSLAAGRAEEALTLLEHVSRSARASGHMDAAISSHVLTAIAWQGKPAGLTPGAGQSVPALKALEEALSLAGPGGYVRAFLDEGRPMQMLLAQWLAQAGASPLRDYAVHLLSQFDAEPHAVTAVQERDSPASALVEPITERELEVLRLVAEGLSNKEIAEQLIIATGTVKAHVHHIYGKLEVSGRMQAIARARALGLFQSRGTRE